MPGPSPSHIGIARLDASALRSRLTLCNSVPLARPLGARRLAGSLSSCKPSLLACRVKQAERDAPPAPPTETQPDPQHPSPNSSQDAHASPKDTQQDPSAQQAQPGPSSSSSEDGAAPRVPPPPRQQRPADGPGPGTRRPIMMQRPGTQTLLATYGAYIGAVGTMAVGAAWAADINLAAMFRWSPEVVQTALVALLPLVVLNTAIMLPDYSTWSLPKLESREPEDAAFMQQQQQQQQGGQPAQTPTGSSTGASPPAPAAPSDGLQQSKEAAAPAAAAATTEPSQDAANAAARAANAAVASSSSSDSSSDGGSSSTKATPGPAGSGFLRLGASPSKPGMVSASSWGQPKPPMRILKDAMHLAQGHYTANNPTVDVNPALELVLSFAQSLAGEMLYRGVAITLLQAWLLDRFYEAGAEDVLSLPLLSSPMDTRDAAHWAAAWLLIAISVGLAARKVIAAPRPRIATIVDLRAAARRSSDGDADGAAGSSKPGAGAPRAGTDAPAGVSPSSSSMPRGQLPLDGPMKPRAPQPGWAPQGFQQVTTLAAIIQGLRNVSQTLIFNCLFVASGGNLAATFTASLANQLLFSVLQRQSMQRMQKRSAVLAKELEVLNRRLREIHQKNKARLNSNAAADATAATAVSAATATIDVDEGARAETTGKAEGGFQGDRLQTRLQGEEEAAELASVSDPASRAGPEAELLHAAAVATAVAASAADASSAVVAAAAAAAVGVGAGPSGGSVAQPPDQLTRALMALDRLLPAEPEAAGKGK